MKEVKTFREVNGRGFILLLLVQILLAFSVSGQTATCTIPHLMAEPGEQVVVPLLVAGFSDLGAMTLFFAFDQDVIVYDSYQNAAITGFEVNSFVNGQGVSVVAMSWSTAEATNIPDGTLIEFLFDYAGGSSDLTFDETLCEIAIIQNGSILELEVEYTNGSITPNTWVQHEPALLEQHPPVTLFYGQGMLSLYNHTEETATLQLFALSGHVVSQFGFKGYGLHRWKTELDNQIYLFRVILREKTITGKLRKMIY